MSKDRDEREFSEEQSVSNLSEQYGVSFVTPGLFTKMLYNHFKNTDFAQHRSLHFAVMGFSGIGKTALIRKVVSDLGYYLIEARPSNMDEGQISGFPVPSPTEKGIIDLCMVSQYQEKIKEATQQKKKLVIFYDELNRAKPHIIKSIFNVLDEKIWAGQQLPRDTAFVVAINPPSDVHNVYDIFAEEAALMGRFKLVGMMPNHDDYLEYVGKQANYHPVVKDFILNNPNCLYDYSSMLSGKNYSCPAKWDYVASFLNNSKESLYDVYTKQDVWHNIEASLGKKVSTVFREYIKENSVVFKPTEIIENYEAIRAETSKINTSDLVIAAKSLGEYIGKNQVDLTSKVKAMNVALFLSDLPEDVLQSFLYNLRASIKGVPDNYLKSMHQALSEHEVYHKLVEGLMKDRMEETESKF